MFDVICVDNKNDTSLVLGVKYRATQHSHLLYFIMDDNGDGCYRAKYRFKTVEEIRNEKINICLM